MAYYVDYAANGSTNTFSVPFPYLKKDHIHVYVNGAERSFLTLTWPTPSTVTLSDAAAGLAGKTVRIRRITPGVEPEVVFKPGALDVTDLNNIAKQLLYLIQENEGGGDGDGDPGGPGDGGDAPPIVVGGESSRPASPVDGQVFFNTDTKKIEIFRCTGAPPVCAWVVYEWTPVIPSTNIYVGVESGLPSVIPDGFIWFDTLNGVIKLRVAGAWQVYEWTPNIAPAGVTLGPILPTIAEDGAVHFDPSTYHIYFRVSGAWVGYPWGIAGEGSILVVNTEGDLPGDAGVGTIGFTRDTTKLYVKGTGGWTSDLATANLGPGSVTATMLAAGSVVATKIAAGAVTTDALAANVVTADKMAAASVSAVKIQAGAITTDKIEAQAITGAKIAAATITGDNIVGFTIGADKLAANSITAGKIAAGSISGDKIAGSTITGDKLAVFSISADRIQTNTLILGTQNLQANSVTDNAYAAGGDVNLYGNNNPTQIISVSLACVPGAQRLVTVSYTHSDDPGAISTFGSICRLDIDGSQVKAADVAVQYTNGLSFSHIDQVSRSGYSTFSARVQHNAGTVKSYTTVRSPTIAVVQFKR